LIALLGRGRENVGRQIGAAYAWNTAGAIAGSLAGGFGILPLLSAPGTWRLVAVLLTALAAVAVLYTLAERDVNRAFITIAFGIAALACAFAAGPTAVWRHSGIGAARAERPRTRNDLREWIANTRRTVLWEKDGRESSVAVVATADLAFFMNGKSDGSARYDASTQVGFGLVGAALHPNPKAAMVVGLGTGSTSGWLAQIPSMERVETAELEPVILDVARACGPVNANAMENPKVRITIADAREMLLASDATYDLIVSEPSNPYRAGVASLFTREFYQAADRRLAKGGYVMQWVQAYAMHAETMRTIYATLSGVFPHVQTWWTSSGDLLLLASRDAIAIDAAALRARLATEPYRSAFHHVWRSDNLEQFLGHMVTNEDYARAAAKEATDLNTDDRAVIEFGFARSIDATASLITTLSKQGDDLRQNRPASISGPVDWEVVDANRLHRLPNATRPLNLAQVSQWALALIERGDEDVGEYIDLVRPRQPIEADVILASLLARQGRLDESAQVIHRALVAFRRDPWPDTQVMSAAVTLALRVGRSSPQRARLIHDAMSQPFLVFQQENFRRWALVELAPMFDGCGNATLDALRAVEPHTYWVPSVLEVRAECYARAGLGELADRAWLELVEYKQSQPALVVTPPTAPAPPRSF
ncbi:MAG TPA: fused MFS/spermidine synthase, partial [Thermoanaerobaculia bacterium]|nr:fused MFS/spermidine synthase [Thermoanaerobaculia bacterium]